MLELLSSKVVSAVAVLALIASVLGFFAMERSSLEEQHFRDLCDSLGGAIDSLSGVNGETRLNFTFSEGRPGLRLDASFRGGEYAIEVRSGEAVLRQRGLTAVHAFVRGVHPWDPALLGNGTACVGAGYLDDLDSKQGALKITSGKDFQAERKMVVVSGAVAYLTFVHA